MMENQISGTNKIIELEAFFKQWDEDYKAQAKNIDLFNPVLVAQWTSEQRCHLIQIFYHSRGHFRDFLWHLGNFTPDKFSKDIILENIAEEFNAADLSHEQLYLDFSK